MKKNLIGKKVRTYSKKEILEKKLQCSCNSNLGKKVTISSKINNNQFNIVEGGYIFIHEIKVKNDIEELKDYNEKILEKIKDLEDELEVNKSKIKLMKEYKIDNLSDDDWKAYQVLNKLNLGDGDLETAKEIMKIINK